MTQVVKLNYKPRKWAKPIHDDKSRFKVVVASRRAGKTMLAIAELVKKTITCPKPNPITAYISPTFRQSKNVAWEILKRHVAPMKPRVNESELTVWLPNGGKIMLLSAENYEGIRGMYLDYCVLDEVALFPEPAYDQVLRPALSDRQGGVLAIGTPAGKGNLFHHFYEKAGHLKDWSRYFFPISKLKDYYEEQEIEDLKAEMSQEAYRQEFECDFSVGVRGAFYAKEMEDAEHSNRLTKVHYDPEYKTFVSFDLGISDSTSIWFGQKVGNEIRIIDFYENNAKPLDHYITYVKKKNYNTDIWLGPHDIQQRELITGTTRLESARKLGVEFQVVPKISVSDGIDAARKLIRRTIFDKDKCAHGIVCLQNYRRDYNEKLRVLNPKPLHDYTSHAADAFRYLAVGESIIDSALENWIDLDELLKEQDCEWVT